MGLKRTTTWACWLTALLVPGTAHAATIAPAGRATPVREYAGAIVFSQFDAGTRQWHLAVRRAGGTTVERVPVAPSPTPFEADIGPDGAGRPTLIYQRCAASVTGAAVACDLFLFPLATATGEVPVRNANHPAHDDVTPTLWRGRIAWTRVYGAGPRRAPVVYTRSLTAPRTRRSQRLPGVPRRRCGDVNVPRECASVVNRSVTALELRAENLALVVRYECRVCSGIYQTELRLDRIKQRESRQVAFQTGGLAGQALIGPSFFAGTLAWYKACQVEPTNCRRGGPHRYSTSTRRYQRGADGSLPLAGFADTGSRLYTAVDCASETFQDSCRIEEIAAPRYSATPRPRR